MLRIFSKNGMYFKNAETIDKLASINHFVLDKTGTLTGRKVEIHFEGTALTEAQKQLIHTAASQSNHPLSKALRDYLSSYTTSHTDISFNELVGKGIEAQIGNSQILLGNSEFCSAHNKVATSETSVHVNIDGFYIGRFEFRFAWRDNIEASIQLLKKQGDLSVVSGDNDADAIRLQQLLGHETSLSFRQLPIDKLNHVKALQQQGKQVAMIGDGLNDAGALLQSDCGITISDEVNNFSPACDIILEAKSFSKLESLLKLTRRSKTIIYLSFAISLLYNVVGVGLAVQGEMQPVFAAILMPISTLSIILFTTGASRFSAYRLGLS
jgi:Cu+-exporting ATPase